MASFTKSFFVGNYELHAGIEICSPKIFCVLGLGWTEGLFALYLGPFIIGVEII
jgi:hypothetical protein